MKRNLAVILLLAVLSIPACLAAEPAGPVVAAEPVGQAAPAEAPLIQVAILLDNSGSMSGLIDQARTQLWSFVNELITARQDGVVPRLEVGLYIYGNPPATQLSGLTRDLDLISERLFAVTIGGSSEYCGAVIMTAVQQLEWSGNPRDLKIIFIAGNEPFTQGPINYREACHEAAKRGIVVNTIHCGDDAAGISGQWREGALLAEGSYLCIDQNSAVARITAPQDAQITALGQELNETYVPFGAAGAAGAERQQAQDDNAAAASPSVANDRFVTRANAQYTNEGWDLVDAVNQNAVNLEEVAVEELPEPMQAMTLDERREFVATQSRRRRQLQQEINSLNDERQQFINDEQQRLADEGEETLGQAMRASLREQAADREFVFAPPAPAAGE